MASCSIRWCGKSSKTSNFKTDGITFHRFPKKPDLKEKWIERTKKENWFPTNYSVVCSRHFTADCFNMLKNRRRLFDTAIPTQYLPMVSDDTEVSECLSESEEPMPSLSSQNKPILTAPKRKIIDLQNPSQFHEPTNKRLCRRVLELSSKVKQKNNTIKVLRDRMRYYKKKVATLKNIIKDLEEKSITKAEDRIEFVNIKNTERVNL